MPKLLQKDDVVRTAIDLVTSQEVWADSFNSVSGEFNFSLPHGGSYQVVVIRTSPSQEKNKKKIRFGALKEKLKDWDYEADRAMDEEIISMFECLKENP